MSFRPAGTDGSDFNYRQTIDKRYQMLAQLRSTAGDMAMWQVLPGALVCIYHALLGHFITGSHPVHAAHYALVASAACALLWRLGRAGSSKESQFLLSASAAASLAATGLYVASAYLGILAAPADTRLMGRVSAFIKDHFNLKRREGVRYTEMLQNLETLTTVLTAILMAATVFTLVRYILVRRAAVASVAASKKTK